MLGTVYLHTHSTHKIQSILSTPTHRRTCLHGLYSRSTGLESPWSPFDQQSCKYTDSCYSNGASSGSNGLNILNAYSDLASWRALLKEPDFLQDETTCLIKIFLSFFLLFYHINIITSIYFLSLCSEIRVCWFTMSCLLLISLHILWVVCTQNKSNAGKNSNTPSQYTWTIPYKNLQLEVKYLFILIEILTPDRFLVTVSSTYFFQVPKLKFLTLGNLDMKKIHNISETNPQVQILLPLSYQTAGPCLSNCSIKRIRPK